MDPNLVAAGIGKDAYLRGACRRHAHTHGAEALRGIGAAVAADDDHGVVAAAGRLKGGSGGPTDRRKTLLAGYPLVGVAVGAGEQQGLPTGIGGLVEAGLQAVDGQIELIDRNLLSEMIGELAISFAV